MATRGETGLGGGPGGGQVPFSSEESALCGVVLAAHNIHTFLSAAETHARQVVGVAYAWPNYGLAGRGSHS